MERRKPQMGKQLLLRFPEGSDLRDRLEVVARANSRSTTAEALLRLEASFREEHERSTLALQRISSIRLTGTPDPVLERLTVLEQQVAELQEALGLDAAAGD